MPKKDGLTQFEFQSHGGTGGFELARLTDEEAASIGETAVRLLEAAKVAPGYHDCICSPELAGLIAHEAFGHGVEADMFLKGRARAEQYVGRRVGSEVVDLIDDPTLPGAYGSYFFDDEGVEASPTYILHRAEVEQENSSGASGDYTETSIYIEMVLSSRSPYGDESERYVWSRRRRLEDLDIEGWVQEEAARATDSVAAGPPRMGAVELIIERNDVARLLGPILFHVSGQAAYLKLARLAPGGALQPLSGDGEPLTLVNDGLLPFGTRTKTPFAQLCAAGDGRPLLRVVEFSSFEPDPVTGDFVAEIRLGYEGGGAEARPVKGGAVRGNVFEVLAGARFAVETGFFGEYAGPVAARLPGVVVAGD